MSGHYLTAIIICDTDETTNTGKKKVKALKYRNIHATPAAMAKFFEFAASKPGAAYVNFYDKTTKNFHERVYLK